MKSDRPPAAASHRKFPMISNGRQVFKTFQMGQIVGGLPCGLSAKPLNMGSKVFRWTWVHLKVELLCTKKQLVYILGRPMLRGAQGSRTTDV